MYTYKHTHTFARVQVSMTMVVVWVMKNRVVWKLVGALTRNWVQYVLSRCWQLPIRLLGVNPEDHSIHLWEMY
jgi:hypothetical protein